jgi:murein DD-endopeptidase MepM/ murein hydrolase activator NlpD
VVRIALLAAAAGALVLALGASATTAPGAAARAWAVQVLEPGQDPVAADALTAPHDAAATGGRFAFPADGSVVSAESTSASVNAAAASSTAGASSGATSLSLFGGEIVAATATAEARSSGRSGRASGSGVEGLTVLGSPVAPAANQRVPLAGWGYLTVLKETGTAGQAPEWDESVTALDVVLTADHGGLPAGSEIQVGHAEAWARSAGAIPTITIAAAPPKKVVSRPPAIAPRLGQGGYVFPVYRTEPPADTFGAARPDVSGGWHHGDDVFAPIGTPVLAVAHGVVFSVGWERLGGWRLWLRDDVGNEYYYAHLSAYSPLAVNGAVVSAGDVLGFVGRSGDAESTPSHLHFEIHPVGLLGRGYDGAVDPTSYLRQWRQVKYLPPDSAAGWTPRVILHAAPKVGAVLLRSTDISAASGLDPASLARVLSGTESRSRPGT